MQLVRILYTYRYCILQLSRRASRRRADSRNSDARDPLSKVRATIDIDVRSRHVRIASRRQKRHHRTHFVRQSGPGQMSGMAEVFGDRVYQPEGSFPSTPGDTTFTRQPHPRPPPTTTAVAFVRPRSMANTRLPFACRQAYHKAYDRYYSSRRGWRHGCVTADQPAIAGRFESTGPPSRNDRRSVERDGGARSG